jgi:prolyl-tRNA editing enzyme YbaK/EbsC (Cys-tRNA(Pro) deacylase)
MPSDLPGEPHASIGCPPMTGGDGPSGLGLLEVAPALARTDLLALPVLEALRGRPLAAEVGVAEIDPELADTAAFCERYGVGLDVSANCVVVAARREGQTRLAACVVLASTRADVNGLVRRHLQARKVSFAPTEEAVRASGMEYGGITPLGLPPGWPLLIDDAVVACFRVVVGSGLRRSKLVLPGAALRALPHVEVLPGLGRVSNGA